MKAILKFDRTDIDEDLEFMQCTKAGDMARALWDINYDLARDLTYFIQEKKPSIDEINEKLYVLLESILEVRKINLDELNR